MCELIENGHHTINRNNEDIDFPMWLENNSKHNSNQFLFRIIHDDLRSRNSYSDKAKVQIKEFSLKIATQKGDNYASIMYRLTVNFIIINANNNVEDENRSYILKLFPSGELQKLIMIKNNIFPREMKFYSKVLVQINMLLNTIGDRTRISPNCIGTYEEPKTMLVFEDLAVDGFRMKNRQSGLDYEETMILFTKLAKLHACTAHLYSTDRSLMDEFLEGCINDNPDRQDFLIFYKYNAKMLQALVGQWDEHKNIASKLENFDEKILRRGYEIYQRDDKIFNVLNHSDLWVNNLMFKYGENNQIDDILLLDYQLAYWGSPGVDINFVLYGSVQDHVRTKYFKHFIRHYHVVLVNTLRALKYEEKIPTVQDIHVEIIKTGFHAVNASINLRPLASMDNAENAEMDVFLKDTPEGEEFRKSIFFNPTFVTFIRSQIEDFDLMGYFD